MKVQTAGSERSTNGNGDAAEQRTELKSSNENQVGTAGDHAADGERGGQN